MLDEKDSEAIKARIAAIEDAFPRDDLGKPDYHAHRKEHLENRAQSELRTEIQYDAAKQVIAWGIGIMLTSIAAFWSFK